MDEEPGKVIDVTARARHWRGSRPRPSPEADGDEARASAPKSLASSLLVPAEMLDATVATPPGEHASPSDGTPVAAGGASAATGDISGGGERNLFLSPDAAVIDQPVQRPKRITGVLRSVRDEVARRRGVLRLPARRTIQLSHPRRLAVALALVAVVAAVAGLVTQPQTPSRTSTRAGGGPAAIAELGGLKGAFLASIARALGGVEAAGRSHPAHTRTARRPGGHKPAITHKALDYRLLDTHQLELHANAHHHRQSAGQFRRNNGQRRGTPPDQRSPIDVCGPSSKHEWRLDDRLRLVRSSRTGLVSERMTMRRSADHGQRERCGRRLALSAL